MNIGTKILKNVFLSTNKNKLILANIIFDNKIQKIEIQVPSEFTWKEVNTTEKKFEFIKKVKLKPLPKGVEIIDGEYNLAIPGAIDPHVHFDTPGFEFRDTFEHGTKAAAFGGVTTIIDMPCTSLPPVTSLENFNTKLNAVKNRSLIDFTFWGGVCGNDFENGCDIEKNINDLNASGVAAYKGYFISGMNSFKDLTMNQFHVVAKIIEKTEKPFGVHAEDKYLVETRQKEFILSNKNSWMDYCKSRDSEAETKSIKNIIEISKVTGVKVHVVHLSSNLGLNEIKEAQGNGIRITSETCPHYLYFTQNDFENRAIKNFLKTAPPVKMQEDQDSLWDGLKDGTLSFVTTDHAGCNPMTEKISENFWEVYGGIPGVEHRVPFLFSEGFLNNKLSLEQTINLLSTNVSDYFKLSNKGKIEKNYDADFALINLWDSEIVKSENMHSKGKYTPFEGIKFNCKVEKTILRGKVIMDLKSKQEDDFTYGRYIEVH